MNIMKNVKVIGYGLWVIGMLLVSMPTHAQKFSEQDQPKAQFQSTSVMQTSGSVYASQPAINEDGTAYSPSQDAQSSTQAPSGPRKSGTPGNQGSELPVGDAVLPLTLIALAFCGVIYLRRRKTLNS